MKRTVLDFDRPSELQAPSPAEQRGLARDEVRLMVTTASGHRHARFHDLARFLAPGTLLVVNSSRTLAASLPAGGRLGDFVLNLSTDYGAGLWLAEPRWSNTQPGPLPLVRGETFAAGGLAITTVTPHPRLPRLWFVQIDGDGGAAMARVGAPIRYAYLAAPYPPLDDYQTVFAHHSGSAEMPSAGRPFSARVIADLEQRGVRLASVELHTGVSSHEVESEEIEDHALYAEPFAVSAATADAVNAARRDGRPVIAVGTTVVRALESAWDGCGVRATRGFTQLYIRPGRAVHTIDGLITGLHDPLASHLAMLFAVAEPELVRDAYDEAVREGYLWHEFGDSHLILPTAA